MPALVLTTAYLPPIQYFSKIINTDLILIEQFESYSKQSYRNRCEIYGANGKISLSIPIVKNHKRKTLIKDIKIDYDTNWQKNHWKSIESAYNSSPYFEHFLDYFLPFFQNKFVFLFDYNLDIISAIFSILEIKAPIERTRLFKKKYDDCIDYRYALHPKPQFTNNEFIPVFYNQVFIEKHGFISNLSIIDLIFNEGPNSIEILKKSKKKRE
ncbi:MAG: WbqC family protein [Bacteroidales bacterium]|nr:WbqC family protein [Bacteroidales bacterium]